MNPDLQAEGRRLVHDATVAPWPVRDNACDLFVALQVFEHLGGLQTTAFAEVRRVARNAILSLPIGWEMADPTNAHHQLSHEHVMTWFAPVVPTRIVVGNGGRKKRLIYVFEDLPGSDPVQHPRLAPGPASAEGEGAPVLVEDPVVDRGAGDPARTGHPGD